MTYKVQTVVRYPDVLLVVDAEHAAAVSAGINVVGTQDCLRLASECLGNGDGASAQSWTAAALAAIALNLNSKRR